MLKHALLAAVAGVALSAGTADAAGKSGGKTQASAAAHAGAVATAAGKALNASPAFKQAFVTGYTVSLTGLFDRSQKGQMGASQLRTAIANAYQANYAYVASWLAAHQPAEVTPSPPPAPVQSPFPPGNYPHVLALGPVVSKWGLNFSNMSPFADVDMQLQGIVNLKCPCYSVSDPWAQAVGGVPSNYVSTLEYGVQDEKVFRQGGDPGATFSLGQERTLMGVVWGPSFDANAPSPQAGYSLRVTNPGYNPIPGS